MSKLKCFSLSMMRERTQIIFVLSAALHENFTCRCNKVELFAENHFLQNKNLYIRAFFRALVHNSGIEEAALNYLVPGKSRMPCDRDFGRIEKKKHKR